VVRAADLGLPPGRLVVDGGEHVGGAMAAPADLGATRGPHPWFPIMARTAGGRETPASAWWAPRGHAAAGEHGWNPVEPALHAGRSCVTFGGPRGAGLVVFDDGDGDGGFPGRPPRHVRAMTACRRAAVARGVSRGASVTDCARRLRP
jgi:hypothetical protein